MYIIARLGDADFRLPLALLTRGDSLMAKFTVDTHLFRELGELLVGRESTALVELIKNSYDADATEVVVFGEGLARGNGSVLSIRDNGVGMTRDQFELGFLRIASRAKEIGERRTPRLGRRFTGAKGIGRLAAHKLARMLIVNSVPWVERQSRLTSALEATIDWDAVEQSETLDDLKANAVTVKESPAVQGAQHGTTITLRHLRRPWSSGVHARFLEEVEAFEAPRPLTEALPPTIVPEQLLFRRPLVRDVGGKRNDVFSVTLQGDLEPPEPYWQAALAATDWILEIDCDAKSANVRYAIQPTLSYKAKMPDAEGGRFEIQHPTPDVGPFFHARVLVRTGSSRQPREVRSWLGAASGVRVFLEGFRVLPYGEARNDWLNLDRDYAERSRGILARAEGDPLLELLPPGEAVREEGLHHLANKHYLGGVFLTESQSQSLRLLVNREGFVPDRGFDTLALLVRGGIDLTTRLRARARSAIAADRRALRRLRARHAEEARKHPESMPTAYAVGASLAAATEALQAARSLVVKADPSGAIQKIDESRKLVDELSRIADEMFRENSLLRLLASVGTQLASFVHEINAILGMAQTLEATLDKLRKTMKLKPDERRQLAELGRGVADLRRHIERHASYLVDVVSVDARRRRSREGLADRLDAAAKLVTTAAEQRGIVIQNGVPRELKSPPMFPAELTTVFANLLSNAVKAAGAKGLVKARGVTREDGGAGVTIENTGVAVHLPDAERWFRPFESTTTKVDAVLGQGLGLGLPITRSILEEYGATVEFVKPSGKFATAIRVTFPE